ncbi:MAG: transaldolase family protein [Candidatus Thermoplasmatota archaeon]|nr:transaldolase family protein [Candidatus Thermoplasmatota archaeon]
MKIFIDTADLNEIKEAYSWGIVDGVTTNPSLIKKAVGKLKGKGKAVTMEEYIKEICLAVDGPVSLEVKGTEAKGIIKEAELLYEKFNPVNNNVVIKVPVNTAMDRQDENFEGVKAIKWLESRRIPTNATLVMTAEQALMAAKAGASYASPFLGRVDDYIRKNMGIEFEKGDYHNAAIIKKIEERRIGEKMKSGTSQLYRKLSSLECNDRGMYSGVELVESITKIYRAYGFKTKIIAASIRNARQAREGAELGVDIATIPFNVIKDMMTHYKTTEGMKKFTDDVVPEYRALFE